MHVEGRQRRYVDSGFVSSSGGLFLFHTPYLFSIPPGLIFVSIPVIFIVIPVFCFSIPSAGQQWEP